MIYLIAGARPNFMKVAPLIKELKLQDIDYKLIHTGQHYDYNMSKIFFKDLGMPEPDIHLDVGSHSHAVQTAKIMIEFEKIILQEKPSAIIVVGDVNSTIACALVAKKLFIPIIHVEAGLRSFDQRMPEEINRILTDGLSDLLFTTEKTAEINLKKEGIDSKKIFFVGNVMIDSLIENIEKTKNLQYYKKFDLKESDYALMTIHRASNVDNKEMLEKIIDIFVHIQKKIKLFFPMHPRTKKNLEKFNLIDQLKKENIIFSEPLGYLEFLDLMNHSRFILTDSGGIQEEASFLKIPVLTLRENTERPITIEQGTNTLVGNDFDKINFLVDDILTNQYKKGKNIEKWDGDASKRIVKIIKEKIFNKS